MIDPRTLEHEYDPRGGTLGRATGRDPRIPHWWVGPPSIPVHPSTVGMSPEEVDLSDYKPFALELRSEFPIYGSDGSLTNIRWRAWTRCENERHYCIVFEDFWV